MIWIFSALSVEYECLTLRRSVSCSSPCDKILLVFAETFLFVVLYFSHLLMICLFCSCDLTTNQNNNNNKNNNNNNNNKYHLLTEREVIAGKPRTETLMYCPTDSKVNTSRSFKVMFTEPNLAMRSKLAN